MHITRARNLAATTLRLGAGAGQSPTPITGSNPLKPALRALLPPLQLYRRLLRAHRTHLPAEMRVLGDEYVKSEFRAHRDVENPSQVITFLSEWQLYAQKVEGERWKGEKLENGMVERMSEEQVRQLYDLMQAIRKMEEEGGESS
ncbi:related to acetate non-utilizing protein 9, mitochondrial precursor [Cephalotrichum gorgonifer]|uniref:Succinate dehydrogenase assembly factor 3 n=1 Tax=Cephalotrichum gorgonifer TaxID=2041049 RepID=A0AAE8MPL7_9PEZI|nr:related to acetate non-utilizing protein 9, mitochondrial precursor [Cephalotrichum gorgonifer]